MAVEKYYDKTLAKYVEVPSLLIGGGSSSTEYSTDEQLIGKWIDGKDIYRKTISFKTKTSLNVPNKIGQTISTLGIDSLINLFGFTKYTPNSSSTPTIVRIDSQYNMSYLSNILGYTGALTCRTEPTNWASTNNAKIRLISNTAINNYPNNFVKIWTNSNTGVSFGAQTISLDLTPYEAAMVNCKFHTSQNSYLEVYSLAYIGEKAVTCCDAVTNTSYGSFRGFTVSNNGIYFYLGNGSGNSKATTNDGAMAVPINIYGIKESIDTLRVYFDRSGNLCETHNLSDMSNRTIYCTLEYTKS